MQCYQCRALSSLRRVCANYRSYGQYLTPSRSHHGAAWITVSIRCSKLGSQQRFRFTKDGQGEPASTASYSMHNPFSAGPVVSLGIWVPRAAPCCYKRPTLKSDINVHHKQLPQRAESHRKPLERDLPASGSAPRSKRRDVSEIGPTAAVDRSIELCNA